MMIIINRVRQRSVHQAHQGPPTNQPCRRRRRRRRRQVIDDFWKKSVRSSPFSRFGHLHSPPPPPPWFGVFWHAILIAVNFYKSLLLCVKHNFSDLHFICANRIQSTTRDVSPLLQPNRCDQLCACCRVKLTRNHHSRWCYVYRRLFRER